MNRFEKFKQGFLYSHGLAMSFIKERNDYHPEYSLLQHTLTVLDNVEKHKDINLKLVALFHDRGKIDTYKEYNNSYDHEVTSTWIVKEYEEQIFNVGGNIDVVLWLVRNHIRAARVLEGHKYKDAYKLTTHKWWELLKLFSVADDMLNDTDKDLNLLLNKDIFVTSNEGELFTGNCDFLGYNNILKTKQVTVGRTPIRINNYNQICSYFDVMIGKSKKN